MNRALESAAYDVVHVNQPHGYLAAKALAGRAVFVHRSHGVELHVEQVLRPWQQRLGAGERRPLRQLASSAMAALLARHSRLIACYADGHIVSNSGDADFLQRELRVYRARVAVIPQAAPDDFLKDSVPVMTDDRLRRILYVGQYAFFKAPMVVAAAMTRLARNDAGRRLTWVCSRAHHDDVRALLGEDVRDRVTLLDWMPTERLIDVYDRHGIFLFGSFYEGFGKVVLEAMSRGLCVVASDIGGAHDVIASGRNGLLVPAGDAEAMASAAESLLADPAIAMTMSQEAARDARSYTWERVARETAAFYETLLARRVRR
jgi:glycosyltransferase involved in cell wall biosynthesis